jgi:cytochrome c peroxidase
MRARSSPFVRLVTLSLGIGAVGIVSCQTADQDPADEDLSAAQGSSGSGSGDTSGGSGGLRPLSTVPVPAPVGGDIVNRVAAVRLGKALFWDVQSGGDGKVACATCHFKAGADGRTMNVINPGNDGLFASGGVSGAGQMFNSSMIFNDDRVGSQGVVGSTFVGINPDTSVAADMCTANETAPFYANRRVTGRNTPPAVSAVFNRDNFWDGRANHSFNGSNPFGSTGNGSGPLAVGNSSLASQAVGPPNNDTEMSCLGRTFNGPNSLAAKMLARTPLRWQLVDKTDGVLGSLSAAPATGLTVSYTALISAAFGPALASDAQNQFSRIWGQAIAAYEATLVPDQTPLDRYLAGNSAALTDVQKRGLGTFTGKGGCINCHAGPELTDASIGFAAARGLINEDGGDQGFHNIGVRPTAEDPGRAGTGPANVPWSVSGATADHGAFKTPALRDVKLTAPYMHNGGLATLEQVVDFYSRGGDFANAEKSRRIKPLSFDASDKYALVDFLRNALTDCRVENERAPFDHPSIELPNGGSLAATGAAGKGYCP